MIGKSRRRIRDLDDAPIGFLLASGKPPADAHAIAEIVGHLTNGHPHLRKVEVHDPGPDVAMVVVGGNVPVMVQWIDGPFPTERVPEEAERHAAAIRGHGHHLAVLSPGADSERGTGEKLLGSLAVIVMLQAAALCTKAHAVCWASSGGLYTPAEWTRGCTRYLRDGLIPVELLVRLITNIDRGRVYVSTMGMSLFGLREIEVWDSGRSPEGAREIVVDAVLDSLTHGEIVGRGRVWNWRVGPAEFRARSERSVLEHGQKVTTLVEV